jgi:hypothetical protein
MDEFTMIRITRLIGTFKESHGRDISEAEILNEGIPPSALDHLVREGVIDKYQVTSGKGSRENRFKVHRDWRSLRT